MDIDSILWYILLYFWYVVLSGPRTSSEDDSPRKGSTLIHSMPWNSLFGKDDGGHQQVRALL